MTDFQPLLKRPNVIRLVKGAHIPTPMRFEENLVGVPLPCLGMRFEAAYLFDLVRNHLQGSTFTPEDEERNAAEAAQDSPVVALAFYPTLIGHTSESIQQVSWGVFDKAEKILSLYSGNPVFAFAQIENLDTTIKPYLLRWPFPKRLLPIPASPNLFSRFDNDEHFAFAMSLFADANAQRNSKFAIAHYFCCLESLAYRIKASGRGSRDAVRELLGIEDEANFSCTARGTSYKFDLIAFIGRLRDSLYHGAEFSREKLPEYLRPAFDFMEQDISSIRRAARDYCEMELRRWANGVSAGQK